MSQATTSAGARRWSCTWTVLALSTLMPLVVACGDDEETGEGGGGAGGNPTTSTSSGTGGSSSASTTTSASTGTSGEGGGGAGGGAADVPCGDVVCTDGDACQIVPIAPECTNLREGEMCPEGTTESICGGAGVACCCGETPAPERACRAPMGCEGSQVSCECLDADFCPEGRQCLGTGTPGEILCEEPPVP